MDAEKIILDYISELPKPRAFYDKQRFRQASYALWAGEEILKKIRANPDTPAVIVLERFVREMEIYSCRPGIYAGMMFCVAYDIGQDILTKFL